MCTEDQTNILTNHRLAEQYVKLINHSGHTRFPAPLALSVTPASPATLATPVSPAPLAPSATPASLATLATPVSPAPLALSVTPASPATLAPPLSLALLASSVTPASPAPLATPVSQAPLAPSVTLASSATYSGLCGLSGPSFFFSHSGLSRPSGHTSLPGPS